MRIRGGIVASGFQLAVPDGQTRSPWLQGCGCRPAHAGTHTHTTRAERKRAPGYGRTNDGQTRHGRVTNQNYTHNRARAYAKKPNDGMRYDAMRYDAMRCNADVDAIQADRHPVRTCGCVLTGGTRDEKRYKHKANRKTTVAFECELMRLVCGKGKPAMIE